MSSQYGQDRFVLDILGGKRSGFFLDSGASDGVTGSNTVLLESAFGWSGICVEPDESFFAQLVRNRQCICVNCCLYDRETTVTFVQARALGGILDEYHPTLLDYAHATHTGARTVSMRTRTIRSVLLECAAPPVIDYWSLDTEGSELVLLKSFPYDAYAFRVITVEHNWLPARDEIRWLLESRGYRWINEIGCDDCYVNDSLATRASWRSAAWRRGRPAAVKTRQPTRPRLG